MKTWPWTLQSGHHTRHSCLWRGISKPSLIADRSACLQKWTQQRHGLHRPQQQRQCANNDAELGTRHILSLLPSPTPSRIWSPRFYHLHEAVRDTDWTNLFNMALGASAGSDTKPSHAAAHRFSVVLESLPLTSLCVAEIFPFRRASSVSDSSQAPVPSCFTSPVFNTQQKATKLWSVNQTHNYTYMEISPFGYTRALGNHWTCRKQGVIRQYSLCHTRLVYSCKQTKWQQNYNYKKTNKSEPLTFFWLGHVLFFGRRATHPADFHSATHSNKHTTYSRERDKYMAKITQLAKNHKYATRNLKLTVVNVTTTRQKSYGY